ncbi:hypothetical protein FISHEDRAFT_76993 [Fistulina hepatica ATCC 64428]|uniref:Uncharacterized protein n=1 Tax=Fistulina hepatica ATCC 64428 TaxID=1128425 RepID=A0A0D7A1R1_9AGAR|nr:hypothetical protein FISHEDRAFT_76993 [Fistulina hepatica ATCC 64428]
MGFDIFYHLRDRASEYVEKTVQHSLSLAHWTADHLFQDRRLWWNIPGLSGEFWVEGDGWRLRSSPSLNLSAVSTAIARAYNVISNGSMLALIDALPPKLLVLSAFIFGILVIIRVTQIFFMLVPISFDFFGEPDEHSQPRITRRLRRLAERRNVPKKVRFANSHELRSPTSSPPSGELKSALKLPKSKLSYLFPVVLFPAYLVKGIFSKIYSVVWDTEDRRLRHRVREMRERRLSVSERRPASSVISVSGSPRDNTKGDDLDGDAATTVEKALATQSDDGSPTESARKRKRRKSTVATPDSPVCI